MRRSVREPDWSAWPLLNAGKTIEMDCDSLDPNVVMAGVRRLEEVTEGEHRHRGLHHREQPFGTLGVASEAPTGGNLPPPCGPDERKLR